MNKLVLIFFFTCVILSACKKEKETISFNIEGVVLDINSNSPIENASMVISKREVSSGTFNSSYSKISEQTTAANGEYSLVTPYGGIESFKFGVSHHDYFSKEFLVNPDNLSTEKTNQLNFSIQSKGYININIVNNNPYDQFDEIKVNSVNPSCANCVKFTSIKVSGAVVDTNLVGMVEANKYYKFQYFTTKNGIVNSYNDSVFCIIGDTTLKTLSY
jgi:hypothetical protein